MIFFAVAALAAEPAATYKISIGSADFTQTDAVGIEAMMVSSVDESHPDCALDDATIDPAGTLWFGANAEGIRFDVSCGSIVIGVVGWRASEPLPEAILAAETLTWIDPPAVPTAPQAITVLPVYDD